MSISLGSSEVGGTIFESIAYGIFVMAFCGCIKVLFDKQRRVRPHLYLFFTTLVLFVLITMHFVVDIVRLVQAFYTHSSSSGVTPYYQNFHTSLNVFDTAMAVLVVTVCDIFILYRIYLVWEKNVLIPILPAILCLGNIGTGVAFIYYFATSLQPSQPFWFPIAAVFYLLTFLYNLICTILIAYRIWRVRVPNQGAIGNIVTESCALYTAVLVIIIVAYAVHSNVVFIFVNAAAPLTGTVFCMLILHIAQGQGHEEILVSSPPVLHGHQVRGGLFSRRKAVGLSRVITHDVISRPTISTATTDVPPLDDPEKDEKVPSPIAATPSLHFNAPQAYSPRRMTASEWLDRLNSPV